jgi:hypothetical protein
MYITYLIPYIAVASCSSGLGFKYRTRDHLQGLENVYLILPVALGPGVYSATNINEYQKERKEMFLGSRARPARKTDRLTAICEPTVLTMWGHQHLTTLYASTACYGIALLYILTYYYYCADALQSMMNLF